eukprot:TRINITY_DN1313_c0_g2_i9.p1 TRINITY_DN1313_c0_g2~~TRINITY_DN1313_c0_g2_i9.p1  ORF type:complete len:140 (-),score=28.31 TRINITY_DN1313_c0_g2_i9:142-561(-)
MQKSPAGATRTVAPGLADMKEVLTNDAFVRMFQRLTEDESLMNDSIKQNPVLQRILRGDENQFLKENFVKMVSLDAKLSQSQREDLKVDWNSSLVNLYRNELDLLRRKGFTDEARNLDALIKTKGNVEQAIILITSASL